MLDPYLLLDVTEASSDQEITRAYLKKVKRYSPEKAPEKFQQIRAAYELIKTPRDRLNYRLFTKERLDTQVLLDTLLQKKRLQRPSQGVFVAALKDVINK